MKKSTNIFLSFVFCLLSFTIYGQQNFVPNPSFEDTASFCPDNSGQIFRAKYWFRTNGSPDFYHKCYNGAANSFSVPVNSSGYQKPSVNACGAYSGIYTAAPGFNNANETFAAKLIDSLSKNVKYFVSLKISLANMVRYASNNVGIYFSTKTPSISFNAPPNNFCQINFSQIITDTLNWTKLFTSFISDSNFKYISIGNFKDSSLTAKAVVNNSGVNSAYFLIDDICLSTDSDFVYNYSYNCSSVSILENFKKDMIKIYPNPSVENNLNIDVINEDISTSITDFTGLEQLKLNLHSGKNEIDISNYKNGFYVVRLFNSSKSIIATQKLIILKP